LNIDANFKAVEITDFFCILSTQEPQPRFPTPTSPIEASEWEGLQQCTQNQTVLLKFEFASRTRKFLKKEPTFAFKIHCTNGHRKTWNINNSSKLREARK
jgi:hypothetical protein